MSLIAISPDAVVDYSLVQDTSEDKTIFKIGQIDSITRAYIDDQHYSFKDLSDTQIHTKFLDVVRFGLKGWSNFKDKDGFEVEFKTEEKIYPILGKRIIVSDESIKRLSLNSIVELGFKIISENTFSDQDKKK